MYIEIILSSRQAEAGALPGIWRFHYSTNHYEIHKNLLPVEKPFTFPGICATI